MLLLKEAKEAVLHLYFVQDFITRLQCVFQVRNPVLLMSIQSSVRF